MSKSSLQKAVVLLSTAAANAVQADQVNPSSHY